MPYRKLIGESILQRAEAIAREFGVELETTIAPCRQIEDMILHYIGETGADLLVLGAEKSRDDPHGGLGVISERVFKRAPCRVFIASSSLRAE